MAKAVKLFSGFSMDFTADRQVAVRADGMIFTRFKGRHPKYGYIWGKWYTIKAVPADMREMSQTDACINHRAYFGNDGKPNVRLPN
jgi:hypothetical protein